MPLSKITLKTSVIDKCTAKQVCKFFKNFIFLCIYLACKECKHILSNLIVLFPDKLLYLISILEFPGKY